MELEEEITRRDELIFSMIRNSHFYQNFMLDDKVDIEELRVRFKTDEAIQTKSAKKKLRF